MTQEHEHHEDAGQATFESNIEKSKRIAASGGFGRFFNANKESAKAFVQTGTYKCSDERIIENGYANPGSVLFDLIVLGADATLLADMYRAQGITKITSHDECGAARVAMMKAKPGTQNPTWDEVNAWARETTRAFCKTNDFAFDHIKKETMSPEGHMHPGTAIYVDYVGGFQPGSLAGAEQGYLVSAPIARDPIASTRALIELVAFKPGNAGDLIRAQKLGKMFSIYLLVTSDTEGAQRAAEFNTMLKSLPDQTIAPCIKVEWTVVTR